MPFTHHGIPSSSNSYMVLNGNGKLSLHVGYIIYYHCTCFSFSHSKNKIYCLIKCAIFSYAVSGIDVSEDALRGMKFGPCSVGESYSLASTYEYTKRESVWLNFLIWFM